MMSSDTLNIYENPKLDSGSLVKGKVVSQLWFRLISQTLMLEQLNL